MRKKDNANKCADLGANDTMTWRGRGSTPTLANINSTLRERHPKDGYATGIWLSWIPKVSTLMWRVHKRRVSSFDWLIARGTTTDGTCQLCGASVEFIEHILFICDYSWWILEQAVEVLGGVLQVQQSNMFSMLAEHINSITKRSPAWGLSWTLLCILSWSLWKERNQRVKKRKFIGKEAVWRSILDVARRL